MNYKVFVLIAMIIGLIAAAGCTGLSSGSVTTSGSHSGI
jgi:hypothetical protein